MAVSGWHQRDERRIEDGASVPFLGSGGRRTECWPSEGVGGEWDGPGAWQSEWELEGCDVLPEKAEMTSARTSLPGIRDADWLGRPRVTAQSRPSHGWRWP